MVAREALTLVGAGRAAGLTLAMAGFRMLSQYLSGLSSLDPGIASAAFVMFVITAGAVAIPAIRGSRIDSLTALRHE